MSDRSSRPDGPPGRDGDVLLGKTLPDEPSPTQDRHPAEVGCPFCESTDSELISPFGSQLLTCQRRCRTCQTYFEALRGDRWEG